MVGAPARTGLSSDGELPTSLDPATYRVLRDDLHFTGPAITDDLADMRAVTDRMSTPEAVVRAIAAGADQALLAEPDNYQAAVAALADWGAADVGHRQRMLEAARRLATVLPAAATGATPAVGRSTRPHRRCGSRARDGVPRHWVGRPWVVAQDRVVGALPDFRVPDHQHGSARPHPP